MSTVYLRHGKGVCICQYRYRTVLEKVENQLLFFHNKNIEIAVDDFGAGASSLSLLNKFSINYLKTDQSLIQNLSLDPNKRLLCKAMILMAHELGIKVIAEGIETQEQHQILIDAGCDFGQGFLFSKAVPAQAFEKLLIRD